MTSSVDVAVIDYGMGNLHSVAKALQHVAPNANVWVGNDANTILNAKRVVYPGVGAIRDCIGEIKKRELDTVIKQAAQSQPLLAICVGMQGLMAHSTENGGVECLSVFDAEVELFSDRYNTDQKKQLKVPHMGWNKVKQSQSHPLWKGINDGARFYFVHSYFVDAACKNTAGVTEYGVELAAAVATENVFAVQFHPEKSHKDGLQLLKNFMHWDGQV